MNLALHVTREVKVDIGRFVAVEAKEGLEGDIVTVLIEPLATDGASLIGKVKARADRAVGEELAITAL